MHAGSQECVLYAGMKHVTIVVFHMPNVDVYECINDKKHVLKLAMTVFIHSQTLTFETQQCYNFFFTLVEFYVSQ